MLQIGASVYEIGFIESGQSADSPAIKDPEFRKPGHAPEDLLLQA